MLKQVVAAAVIAGAGAAFATPAQDIFDQASFYVGFYYSGQTKIPSWRELRQKFQPKLDAACAGDANCSYEKAVPVIREMVASLGDSFTNYMTLAEVEEMELRSAGQAPETPRLGILTATLPGVGEVITDVFEGEAAFAADLKRGDLIRTVNGAPATKALLAGTGPMTLVIDRKGARQEVSVRPTVARQAPFLTSQRLPGDIFYIRIPDFYRMSPPPGGLTVSAEFARLVSAAVRANSKGLIVDVRDSYSGYDNEALAAAGSLVNQGSLTYRKRFPNSDEKLFIKDRKVWYQESGLDADAIANLPATANTTLPVVVLVNKRTYNSSEMFAYWLQKAGRARVVGEPTAGELNVSGGYQTSWQLLNEDFINLSLQSLYNDDGSLFPARVTPDVVIPEDLAALAAGNDQALTRALELLGAR
ncbi:MAG TPA: S41 family peptidase [Deinococcales bacterium]|nr:S41 family peptidase [Deinococcales bacterium]